MAREFRILYLAASNHDDELIAFELSKADRPVVIKRVQDRAFFPQALEEFQPRLILTDYRLPSFDGLTALALAQEVCPAVPFIFVADVLSEQLPAGLQTGPAEFRPEVGGLLAQTEGSLILFLASDWRILDCNHGSQRLTGWHKNEILGKNALKLLVPREKRQLARARLSAVMAGKPEGGFSLPLQLRDGSQQLFHLDASLLLGALHQPLGLLVVGRLMENPQAESMRKQAKASAAARPTRRSAGFC